MTVACRVVREVTNNELGPLRVGKNMTEYAWDGRIAMTSDHIPKISRLGRNAYGIHGYSGRGIGPGTVFGTGLANVLLGQSEDELPIQPCEYFFYPNKSL